MCRSAPGRGPRTRSAHRPGTTPARADAETTHRDSPRQLADIVDAPGARKVSDRSRKLSSDEALDVTIRPRREQSSSCELFHGEGEFAFEALRVFNAFVHLHPSRHVVTAMKEAPLHVRVACEHRLHRSDRRAHLFGGRGNAVVDEIATS